MLHGLRYDGLNSMPLDTIPVIIMEIYRSGDTAQYNGMDYTIDHVLVSRNELIVYLVGMGTRGEAQGINAKFVRVAKTTLDPNRL